MIVERNHTKFSSNVRFRIFINGVEKYELIDLKNIAIEEPNTEYTIQFKAMRKERSKIYIVEPGKGLTVRIQVNFYIRFIYFLLALLMLVVFIYGLIIRNYYIFLAIMVPLVVGYIVLFDKVFVRNYISVTAYDTTGKHIKLEEYTENK